MSFGKIYFTDLEKMRRLTQNMANVNESSGGDAGHFYNEGVKAQENGDHREAFKWFKKAAELGHTNAMWKVVNAYTKGTGIEPDKTQVFAWMKRLAEMGEIDAMCWLGGFYETGNGVVPNPSEAFNWTKKSANKGFVPAMYNLAWIYIDRFNNTWRSVNDNVDNAIYWMTKAAEAGTDEINVDAMFYLGKLCDTKLETIQYDENGNIRDYDPDARSKYIKMGKKWFQRAVDLGHSEADDALTKFKKKHEDCFITAAVYDSFGKPDGCYELTAFRKFRDNWLALQTDGKSLIDEYYDIAPKIVANINSLSDSAEIYKKLWRDYLSACLKSIEVGDNFKCKKIYVEMVNTLKEKFLK